MSFEISERLEQGKLANFVAEGDRHEEAERQGDERVIGSEGEERVDHVPFSFLSS